MEPDKDRPPPADPARDRAEKAVFFCAVCTAWLAIGPLVQNGSYPAYLASGTLWSRTWPFIAPLMLLMLILSIRRLYRLRRSAEERGDHD